MSAATIESGAPVPPPRQFGEWFWRFLAMALLFLGGWVAWIAVQISPPDVFLPAAYEAQAKSRASRNSSGLVTGMILPASPSPAPAPAPAEPAGKAGPLVNLDKLRLAESIETPIHDRPKRPARTQ